MASPSSSFKFWHQKCLQVLPESPGGQNCTCLKTTALENPKNRDMGKGRCRVPSLCRWLITTTYIFNQDSLSYFWLLYLTVKISVQKFWRYFILNISKSMLMTSHLQNLFLLSDSQYQWMYQVRNLGFISNPSFSLISHMQSIDKQALPDDFYHQITLEAI